MTLAFDSSSAMKQMYQFQATVGQETEFPCSLSHGQKMLEGKLRLEFKHKLTANPHKDNSKEEGFQEDERSIRLLHRFEVSNEGPSKTNEEQTLRVYIPDIVNKNKTLKIAPESMLSNTDCQSRFHSGGDVDEVCNTGCTHFECKIKKGFKKNDKIFVDLVMRLDPIKSKKGKGLDIFEIMSALKVNEEVVRATTTFKVETGVGLLETIRKVWPIPVGVLAGLIIVGAVTYMAYKKGWLQSLRFTKAKMEMDNYKSSGAENIYNN